MLDVFSETPSGIIDNDRADEPDKMSTEIRFALTT